MAKKKKAQSNNSSTASVATEIPATKNSATSDNKNEPGKFTKAINELKESQDFMSNKYDELLAEVKKLKDMNNEQKREISALTTKCEKLSSEMEKLKTTVNTHEQAKIHNNVVIRGINPAENANTAVMNIAQLAGVEITNDDVTAKQVHNRSKASCILATFKSVEKKTRLHQIKQEETHIV